MNQRHLIESKRVLPMLSQMCSLCPLPWLRFTCRWCQKLISFLSSLVVYLIIYIYLLLLSCFYYIYFVTHHYCSLLLKYYCHYVYYSLLPLLCPHMQQFIYICVHTPPIIHSLMAPHFCLLSQVFYTPGGCWLDAHSCTVYVTVHSCTSTSAPARVYKAWWHFWWQPCFWWTRAQRCAIVEVSMLAHYVGLWDAHCVTYVSCSCWHGFVWYHFAHISMHWVHMAINNTYTRV